MDVNERQLMELISKGENITTEFKTCRNRLNRDVYESVCAFLNRHGGMLRLDVDDEKNIIGADRVKRLIC